MAQTSFPFEFHRELEYLYGLNPFAIGLFFKEVAMLHPSAAVCFYFMKGTITVCNIFRFFIPNQDQMFVVVRTTPILVMW